MGKVQLVVSALLLVLLLVVACAPAATPAPAPQAPAAASVPAPTGAAVSPTTSAKPAWETQWEKTVEAAKREGKVAVGFSGGTMVRRELSAGFKDAHGLLVEGMVGTVAQLSSKILAERRAGLYLWDVLVAGSGGQMTTFKPGGATSPFEPALILPDLTDPEVIKRVWYEGKLPWVDGDRHLFAPLLRPSANAAINPNLVKPGEIRTYDDLLNPKWKGKIVFQDPTLPGGRGATVMPMLYGFKGEDWVRKLVAQEPVISRDDRLDVEWVAKGKYPIAMPARDNLLEEFIAAGAPIVGVYFEDITSLSAGPSTVSLIGKAPHPNTAKVFINWYLSKEGQIIMSKAYVAQSARLDVPTEGLPAEVLRKPGTNYWMKENEENLLKIDDYIKTSKEIFGRLVK